MQNPDRQTIPRGRSERSGIIKKNVNLPERPEMGNAMLRAGYPLIEQKARPSLRYLLTLLDIIAMTIGRHENPQINIRIGVGAPGRERAAKENADNGRVGREEPYSRFKKLVSRGDQRCFIQCRKVPKTLDGIACSLASFVRGGDAYAPPSNFMTGMPSLRALSARFSWIPVPGKTRTPIGRTSSIWSLRLKGAALPCLVQSGLKATCVTCRLSAHFAAISSAPLGEPPCRSTMSGCLAWT